MIKMITAEKGRKTGNLPPSLRYYFMEKGVSGIACCLLIVAFLVASYWFFSITVSQKRSRLLWFRPVPLSGLGRVRGM